MKTNIFEEQRTFKESKILFKSEIRRAIKIAISTIQVQRIELETYLDLHPEFRHALHHLSVERRAPQIVRTMSSLTKPFNIGPMAAVAGVLADLANDAMLSVDARVAIVENGGEIAASSNQKFTVGLYAGQTLLSNRIGFQINPSECPIGIATSSATIGHAISFGEADAVTVFADTSGMADAAATAICNSVEGNDVETSIQSGLEYAKRMGNNVQGIRGVMIIREKYVGSVGRIPRLVSVLNGIGAKKGSLTDLLR